MTPLVNAPLVPGKAARARSAVVVTDLLGPVMRTDAQDSRGFACPATTRVVIVTRLIGGQLSGAKALYTVEVVDS